MLCSFALTRSVNKISEIEKTQKIGFASFVLDTNHLIFWLHWNSIVFLPFFYIFFYNALVPENYSGTKKSRTQWRMCVVWRNPFNNCCGFQFEAQCSRYMSRTWIRLWLPHCHSFVDSVYACVLAFECRSAKKKSRACGCGRFWTQLIIIPYVRCAQWNFCIPPFDLW